MIPSCRVPLQFRSRPRARIESSWTSRMSVLISLDRRKEKIGRCRMDLSSFVSLCVRIDPNPLCRSEGERMDCLIHRFLSRGPSSLSVMDQNAMFFVHASEGIQFVKDRPHPVSQGFHPTGTCISYLHASAVRHNACYVSSTGNAREIQNQIQRIFRIQKIDVCRDSMRSPNVCR
jgi:hypothetical protein